MTTDDLTQDDYQRAATYSRDLMNTMPVGRLRQLCRRLDVTTTEIGTDVLAQLMIGANELQRAESHRDQFEQISDMGIDQLMRTIVDALPDEDQEADEDSKSH